MAVASEADSIPAAPVVFGGKPNVELRTQNAERRVHWLFVLRSSFCILRFLGFLPSPQVSSYHLAA
jgi:hypothetical protein